MRFLFLIVVAFSVHAHAGLFTKVWQGDLVAKALKGEAQAKERLLSAPIADVRESFAAYYSDMPAEASPATKEAAAYLFADWLSQLSPDLHGYWDHRAHFGDAIVYQNHDLIDPRRVPPSKVVLAEKQGAMYALHDGNAARAYAPGLATTDALMRHGHPAVGPEGQPVLVCRLLAEQGSPYFELSRTDYLELASILELSTDAPSWCLSAPTGYWSERHADFFDNHGARIEPRRRFSLPDPVVAENSP